MEGLEKGGESVHIDPFVREEAEDVLRPCVCHRQNHVCAETQELRMRPSPFPPTHKPKHNNTLPQQTYTNVYKKSKRTLRRLPPARKGEHHRPHFGGQANAADLPPQRLDPVLGGGEVGVPDMARSCVDGVRMVQGKD